jgi:transposase
MSQNERPYTEQVFKVVLIFLQLFICETLAKRIVSMMLLAIGVPNNRITELTGLCDKSVRILKKSIEAGELDNLFQVGGGGQTGKLSEFEAEIIKEVNENDYHSQQQIADMVFEKYGIKVAQPTISRFLKKTASSGLNVVHYRQKPT